MNAKVALWQKQVSSDKSIVVTKCTAMYCSIEAIRLFCRICI